MKKVDILCPDCGKLLLRATDNSDVTLFPWCRLCKKEKQITIRANEPPKK